jgi:hypothetical protein
MLLRIAALVTFILIIAGVTASFSLLALGLAFWVASTFVGDWADRQAGT